MSNRGTRLVVIAHLADILLQGIVEDVVHEMGDGAEHSHEGEGGKEEVPGRQEGPVGVARGLVVLHVVLPTEDRDEVDRAEGEGNVGPCVLGPLVPDIDLVVLLKLGIGEVKEGHLLEGLLNLSAADVDVLKCRHALRFIDGIPGAGDWGGREGEETLVGVALFSLAGTERIPLWKGRLFSRETPPTTSVKDKKGETRVRSSLYNFLGLKRSNIRAPHHQAGEGLKVTFSGSRLEKNASYQGEKWTKEDGMDFSSSL